MKSRVYKGIVQFNLPPYVLFAAQVVRNNALYYTLNRLVLQRDNTYTLIEDHAWFHREAPEWLREKIMNPWKNFGPTATDIAKTLPAFMTELEVTNYWKAIGLDADDPKCEIFLKAYRLWHNFGTELV